MLMNATLNSHLHYIDEQANKILEQTVKAFAETDGCDEELKAADQMKRVGLMNIYRHCAEEIINRNYYMYEKNKYIIEFTSKECHLFF